MKKLYAFAVSLLLLFHTSTAQNKIPPVIEWQKALGGSKVDRAYTVIRTFDNGYLVVGESFSNDGNVSGHHGTTDSSDAWVVKLNADGSIQWQQSYGGSRNDRFLDVVQAGNGDFVCIGSSESNNGDVSGLHSTGPDVWVVRINSTGSIIWSKVFGGSFTDDGYAIRRAVGNDGYILATAAKSNDFDVTDNLGYMDIWLLRIDESGSVVWKKSYGNNQNQFPTDISVSSDGAYLVSGYSTTNLAYTLPCQVVYSYYSQLRIKVDANGNTIWQNISGIPCGIPGYSSYNANLLEMPSGQLFFVGMEHSTVTESYPRRMLFRVNPATGQSMDGIGGISNGTQQHWLIPNVSPGPHKNILLPDSTILSSTSIYGTGSQDASLSLFKTKTTSDGDSAFLYRKRYGGTNTDVFYGVASASLDEQQFIAVGTSNSNNGDVSGNHGDYDCWVVKFSSLNQIKGKVFIDNNNNGIKESNESYAKGYFVESKKNGLTIRSSSNKDGNFLNNVDTGIYTTAVKLQRPYYTINPISKQSSFATLNNKDSFDFALVPVPGNNDLRITLKALDDLRPGFKSRYRMDYINQGTEPIASVEVRFIKPSNMNYISAVPAPTLVNGDTLSWNAGTLSPLDSSFIILTLQALPLPGVDLGDVLVFRAQINPVIGDETPLDNKDSLRQGARGSFDPNDKTENYDGTIYIDQLGSFQSLNYTIRFQNTGTDTAFNIIVRDTLTTKLDPSSFEITGVSHPYTFTLKDNKYCTWTFSNIKLLDSNTSEPLSHGYISYRIKPQIALVLADTIRNQASIYFDYNPPVRTNLHETIVKPTPVQPPPQPLVSGLLNSYCSAQGIQKGKIDNLPATSGGITVTVKLDTASLSIAADSTFSFDVAALSAGSHSIQVIFTNGAGSKTTTINFTSAITVTPEVILSANVTTIINSNPVLITASNAAGGGNTPLFTFAKDRDFSLILQTEGSSNVFFLDPAVLVGGDNWIYGRMRTSDSCYTSQTSVDSIKLVKILPPVDPTISGLSTEYCNTMGAQYGKITNLPAAGSGISVEVKLDATILPVAADSTFNFVPYALSGGPHVVTVKYTNVAGSKITTHNFAITSAVMPDVNVSASVTNIVNLTVPVIVTATNAAGGGAGPLYTFGKNRDFTALWQAEGSSNALTITPSALAVGDNWIYVRMKSNALCISNDVGIDSIKLTRDISTGITDPDNPGAIIKLYPNPSVKELYITGLSAAKTYTISLSNLNGQLIKQVRVTNRTNTELMLQSLKGGIYMLTIYDEKKKQLLGSVKIIKQ